MSNIFKSEKGEIERNLFLERLDTKPLDDILTSIKILGNKEDNLESCILELTRKHGNFFSVDLDLERINFYLDEDSDTRDKYWNFLAEYEIRITYP